MVILDRFIKVIPYEYKKVTAGDWQLEETQEETGQRGERCGND